jgi:glycolate oxidase iron-sulfur subunit
LQHGQKLPNLVEGLLKKLGYELSTVVDSHLCCGSAGTYSLFQPEMARQLRDNKLNNLSCSQPDLIVTSNIGCQIHLAKGTKLPVKHWIELLDH